MAELSDAFIALPGGVGPLEEISEVFVWLQLGLHQKPCALLNVNGFYNFLGRFLKEMTEARFMKEEHLAQLLILDQVEGVIEALLKSKLEFIDKWLDRR